MHSILHGVQRGPTDPVQQVLRWQEGFSPAGERTRRHACDLRASHALQLLCHIPAQWTLVAHSLGFEFVTRPDCRLSATHSLPEEGSGGVVPSQIQQVNGRHDGCADRILLRTRVRFDYSLLAVRTRGV